MSVYNLNGVEIADLSRQSDFALFSSNMHIDYKYDSVGDANYTVIRVFKKRLDGAEQYPFVYAPNGINSGTQSTLTMNKTKGFYVAINAGCLLSDKKPAGTLIENGVPLQNGDAYHYGFVLTIDSNGNLGVTNEEDSSALVANGVVSAIAGVGVNPIINNYEIPSGTYLTDNAQRQIIGQFGNGDYAIITCEGRNYDNSDGWTIAEAQRVCQELGLKFAYNLDGGGSTETVIGKKQINTIYENTEGRIVPTYIVFNGTDTFKSSL